jgi:hypothetical protein
VLAEDAEIYRIPGAAPCHAKLIKFWRISTVSSYVIDPFETPNEPGDPPCFFDGTTAIDRGILGNR